MKIKPTLILVLVAVVHCGCLGPEVVQMADDTYLVQKRSAQVGFGPPVAAQAKVYKVANKFASARGMVVETVDFKMVNSSFARPGSVALQFRCVPPQKSNNNIQDDTEKKLTDLKKLFDRGLITQEEYNQKKAKILDALR